MKTNRFAVLLIAFASFLSSANAEGKGQAAFLKSLVVPGWGQYELGRPRHAVTFFAMDLLLIGTALGLNSYGTGMRDDYQAYAAAHAQVIGDHDKNFYADIGNWMTVFDYNDQRMADRDYASLYDTESEFWSWDSENSRARMDEMRVKSERALNRVIYAAALAGVNHLVSAFHAGRLAKTASKQGEERTELQRSLALDLRPVGNSETFGLSLSARW